MISETPASDRESRVIYNFADRSKVPVIIAVSSWLDLSCFHATRPE